MFTVVIGFSGERKSSAKQDTLNCVRWWRQSMSLMDARKCYRKVSTNVRSCNDDPRTVNWSQLKTSTVKSSRALYKLSFLQNPNTISQNYFMQPLDQVVENYIPRYVRMY